MVPDGDGGGLEHSLYDGPHDGSPGLIPLDPGHSWPAVRRFQGLQQASARVGIKRCAELPQPGHRRRAFPCEEGGPIRIHQSGPGRDRIGRMQRHTVVPCQGHGHTPLGPGGRGPFPQSLSGDQQDRAR